MNRFFLLASISIIATSPLLAAPDLDQAAADACKCLKAPYAEISKAVASVKRAQQSGDMSKLMEVQSQMVTILQSSSRCFQALSSRYPDIDKSDELKKQVAEKIEKMCPAPVMGN